MAPGYDISQIGYNPLGTAGLGLSGTYANYDNYMPSYYGMGMGIGTGMGYGMGMDQSIWNANAMGMNPMMMGYYNPAYMAQLQQHVEASQAQHAGNMHTVVLGNEVQAHKITDSAFVQKVLHNASVQQGVQNLYQKVQEGDHDGVCNQMDKLKRYIYDTYREELLAIGSKNPAVDATELIEIIYSNIAEANSGKASNLRDDIIQHGENAFANGFYQSLKEGHHERYTAETLNECFGLDIDNKEHQDKYQAAGKVVGGGVNILKKGAYGAIGGAALYTLGGGTLSLIKKAFGGKLIKFSGGRLAQFAVGAAILTAIADCLWKFTDTSAA